jgi:hypothetical protein
MLPPIKHLKIYLLLKIEKIVQQERPSPHSGGLLCPRHSLSTHCGTTVCVPKINTHARRGEIYEYYTIGTHTKRVEGSGCGELNTRVL